MWISVKVATTGEEFYLLVPSSSPGSGNLSFEAVQYKLRPGMVVHACDPSIKKTKQMEHKFNTNLVYGCSSVVESLPSMYRGLSLTPNIENK